MHDYNTIVGVISLRNDKVSYPAIRQRYGIGNSGIDLIMNRYICFLHLRLHLAQ